MKGANFIDHVKFCARSGKGGAGCIHFRRERFIPKGGPDGGNGGNGGSIILRGNKHLSTLLHLKYRKHVIAEKGRPGEGNNKTGANGKDIILEVPLGTVAKDAETNEKRFEILHEKEEYILTPGGKGGLGNNYFKNSTTQAPRYAQPGQPGKEEWVILELKLLAEVGLVGLPNAGKSTLLSVLSAAKPKIADYPFTTLVPQLGLVPYRDDRSFVMADIPGLIEGASEGRGLGFRFLRHIERNAVLLFVISAESLSIKKDYDLLGHELKNYSPHLLEKRRLLIISKADLIDDELRKEVSCELEHIEHLFISSVTQEGVLRLKDQLWKLLHT